MTAIDDNETATGPTPAEREQMHKYGIRRVPTAYFVYRAYRYTNLADALAQAKRKPIMAD